MTKEELYRSKVISIDEALSKIKSGDFISCGAYGDEPLELLSNIHKIADRVENVRIWTHLTQRPYEYAFNDAYKGRITNGSLTIPKPVGTIELKLVKEGYVTKKYTLTMDTEEENSIFRFPEMTPEN